MSTGKSTIISVDVVDKKAKEQLILSACFICMDNRKNGHSSCICTLKPMTQLQIVIFLPQRTNQSWISVKKMFESLQITSLLTLIIMSQAFFFFLLSKSSQSILQSFNISYVLSFKCLIIFRHPEIQKSNITLTKVHTTQIY